MAIRYVLFDAVGTLIYPDPPVADAYFAAGQRFGSQLTRGEIAERFHNWFGVIFVRHSRVPEQFITSESFEHDRWRALVSKVFDDVREPDPLFEELWRHFGRSESWRLFDDVGETWTRLQKRGYELGIASNFDRRLRTIVAGHPALAPCRHVFLSSEVGHAKPSPCYFEEVQRRLHAQPSEILIVGDDLENDVIAPRRALWHVVAVSREKSCANALFSLQDLLSFLP